MESPKHTNSELKTMVDELAKELFLRDNKEERGVWIALMKFKKTL